MNKPNGKYQVRSKVHGGFHEAHITWPIGESDSGFVSYFWDNQTNGVTLAKFDKEWEILELIEADKTK